MADVSYRFSCAQSRSRDTVERRHMKAQKLDHGGTSKRDRDHMKRFECEGWMSIAGLDTSSVMEIRVKHLEHHIKYQSIRIPEHWKRWIEQNASSILPEQVRYDAQSKIILSLTYTRRE